MTAHWNKLPGEVVESPSREMLRNHLDTTLCHEPRPAHSPRCQRRGGPGHRHCPERRAAAGPAPSRARAAAAGRGGGKEDRGYLARRRDGLSPAAAAARPRRPRRALSLPFPFPGTAAATRRSGASPTAEGSGSHVGVAELWLPHRLEPLRGSRCPPPPSAAGALRELLRGSLTEGQKGNMHREQLQKQRATCQKVMDLFCAVTFERLIAMSTVER
ncbi:uncharacterized protein LOC113967313 [Neopelma chrysocephalum]|uniref:uncharacterized protein LOC113967313 n=1 Tax=Neopelma chrysocephalum TaxID=114329 RepID=UPI000FCD0582|nr:uncharacterized protein LOC113967313 [Neopelma chrysocephalum]